jgi:hypothetical protein
MDVVQILAHCRVPIQVALGEVGLPRRLIGIFFGALARKSLDGPEPTRKYLPTDPEFRVTGARDFLRERGESAALIEKRARAGVAGLPREPHPFFGRRSEARWQALMWKHLDHHRRQFGARARGARSSRIPGLDHRMDPAADGEVSHHRDAARREQRDEVVEDPVGHRLVEVPFAAKRPQVELQAFELDAAPVGNVADADGREIRLPCHRAQAGELRAVEVDLVVTLGIGVVEPLERLRRLSRHRVGAG